MFITRATSLTLFSPGQYQAHSAALMLIFGPEGIPLLNMKSIVHIPLRGLLVLLCLLGARTLPAQLRLIYNESFVSNKANWPEANETDYAMKVAEGSYQLSLTTNTSRWVFIPPLINPRTYFIIEVRFKAQAVDKAFAAGIVWNVDDDSKNLAYWSLDGSVTIEKKDAGTVTALGTDASTHTFSDGKDHTMKVKSFSNRCEFYVDDHLVKKTEKLPFALDNGVGVYVLNKGSVQFDYIKVYQEREEINLATTDFTVTNKENLGKAVNTAYDEVQPVISHDGKTLYFTRKDYPQNVNGILDDAWYSVRDENNNFSVAKNMGKPINNSNYNNIAGFSADEKKLIAFGKYTPAGAYLGDGFCEFTKTENGWGNPQNLNIKNYYNSNDYCEVSYSPDGTVLIFTIERRDTYGGKDLYISLKQADGSWCTPFNAGQVVNTFADEISPFLAGDNKTLYFASEGHSGYGAADVFMTRRLDDTWKNWTKPVNMGPKINSAEWDAYFSIDAKGEWAYMVSNHHSVGKADIFRFKIPSELKPDTLAAEKVLEKLVKHEETLVKVDTNILKDTEAIVHHTETVLKNTDTIREQQLQHKKYQAHVYGKVYDAKTKEVIAATVYIKEVEKNTEIYALAGDVKGFDVQLDEGLHYAVSANYTGYMAETKNLDLTTAHGDDNQQVDIYLKKIEKDQTIIMNNIFFVEGSSNLRYDSKGELTNVAALMQEYPKMTILIGGHTSMNQGDARLNRKLSEERAKSVYDALVRMGVDKKRLKFKGFGHDKPQYDVNSLWENAKNRRVDFTIVSM